MRVPDPILEGAITRRAEPEFDWGWRAGVGIELPIFSTHRAAVAVETGALAQLLAERDALAARIRGEVSAAVALAASRRQQYATFRDEMLPRVTEVEKMAEDAKRELAEAEAALSEAEGAVGAADLLGQRETVTRASTASSWPASTTPLFPAASTRPSSSPGSSSSRTAAACRHAR